LPSIALHYVMLHFVTTGLHYRDMYVPVPQVFLWYRPVCVPAPPGVFFPVHRGEPEQTRDRHTTSKPTAHPPTHVQ
jgi:hypothetical protein